MITTTKYVVLWTEKEEVRPSPSVTRVIETDYYTVFIDGSSAENSIAARKLYTEKLEEEKVSSAHICIIMETTDYTVEAEELFKDKLIEQEKKEEGVADTELI